MRSQNRNRTKVFERSFYCDLCKLYWVVYDNSAHKVDRCASCVDIIKNKPLIARWVNQEKSRGDVEQDKIESFDILMSSSTHTLQHRRKKIKPWLANEWTTNQCEWIGLQEVTKKYGIWMSLTMLCGIKSSAPFGLETKKYSRWNSFILFSHCS